LCDTDSSANRLRNNAAHLSEERILPVKLKILLAAAHFRPKQSLALKSLQLFRQIGRIDVQPPGQILQVKPGRGVREVV